jgi:hypothetical protein
MKLVGVQIVETNYSLTPETLSRLPDIFSVGMRTFDPDMVYGIFSGHPDDSGSGWAYQPGRAALGWVYGGAFRHEIGHNAGGGHCHEPGGGYNFGFNNGKSTTVQCGNGTPYYSTPAVRDAHGLPIGNAATADMARVWRENAARLSSYTVGIPQNFRKTGSTIATVTFSWDPSSDAVRYDVYRNVLNGSEVIKVAEVTGLTYVASTTSSRTIYYVKAVNAQGAESRMSNGASR